jgi:lipoyl(octanoyl) transferase
MRQFRLVRSGTGDAYTNMALDEALLCSYANKTSPATLRLYAWDEPSVSIGLFQDAAVCRANSVLSATAVPFVRRLTGGGMLPHGNEITYSLVCAQDDIGEELSVIESFRKICAWLMRFYRSLGLDPVFAADAPGFRPDCRTAYVLCAQSREKYDIVINARKIGGNAQKRLRGVLFQHGRIPLYPLSLQLNAAPDYTLSECVPFMPQEEQLVKLLVASFEAAFAATVVADGLTGIEEGMMERLRSQKYATDAWNIHRCQPQPMISV